MFDGINIHAALNAIKTLRTPGSPQFDLKCKDIDPRISFALVVNFDAKATPRRHFTAQTRPDNIKLHLTARRSGGERCRYTISLRVQK